MVGPFPDIEIHLGFGTLLPGPCIPEFTFNIPNVHPDMNGTRLVSTIITITLKYIDNIKITNIVVDPKYLVQTDKI